MKPAHEQTTDAPLEAPLTYSQRDRALAWGVHLYTALGLPLNIAAAMALINKDGSLFFHLNLWAVFIDATDGFMARGIKVKERLPNFDGGKLDDLIDFLTFTFLPLLSLPLLGLIPTSWTLWLSIPLISSAYGFCQTRAKTDDAFVGFPSYWNIIALYLFAFQPPAWVSLALLMWLSVMVFVPIHYVYPTRNKTLFKTTMIGGGVFMLSLLGLVLEPQGPYATIYATLALSYTAYYTVISFAHHLKLKREGKL